MRYALLVIGLLLVGCESGPSTGAGGPPSDPGTPSETNSPQNATSQNSGGGSVAALLGRRSIRWSQLRPLMAEAVGGQVLGEWVLDRRIEAALQREQMKVTAEDRQREKSRLLKQLAEDRDRATRLLRQLRERRGLGDRRFRMLLARNAGLRKLVADEVDVSEAAVERAYEQRYGPKTQVRMILVPTLRQAEKVKRKLKEGASFIDLAVRMSKDESRQRGGLLPPISPADASFPQALRQTASKLEKGQVSQPVALDQSFAILKCERKIQPKGPPLKKVRGRLRRQMRLRMERAAMMRKARVLIEEADVTVLDAALQKAWKQQRTQFLQRPGEE